MRDRRTYLRLRDIVETIETIDGMLAGKIYADLVADRIASAAYERFLGIVSEAARHVPPELRSQMTGVPWAHVQALGNQLRHAYPETDLLVLWKIHADGELRILDEAARSMMRFMEAEDR